MWGAISIALALASTAGEASSRLPWTLAHFKHTAWTRDDGAPAEITDLAQTPDGFLWISSVDGLFRFDGVTFEKIDPPARSPFAHVVPDALMVADDGTLWIGYGRGAGVAVLHNGRLIDTNMPKAPLVITALAETPDGSIWAFWGGVDHRVFRYRSGRWKMVETELGLPKGTIIRPNVAPDGTLWATVWNQDDSLTQAVYLSPGAAKMRLLPAHLRPKAMVSSDSAGRIWVADDRHTYVIAGRRASDQTSALRFPAAPGLRIAELGFDDHGGIWGTTRMSGIFHIPEIAAPSGIVETFGAAQGLTSDVTTPILVDREGDIWTGSELGLDRFRPANVWLDPAIPAAPANGLALQATNDGQVFVASGDNLYRIGRGTEPRPILHGIAVLDGTCRGRLGGAWLMMPHRLRHVRDGSETAIAGPPRGESGFVCAEDEYGRLWLDSTVGLQMHDRAGWHDPVPGSTNESSFGMAVDPDDGTVISNEGHNQLLIIKGNRISTISAASIGEGLLGTVSLGQDGIFITATRALLWWHHNRILKLEVSRYPFLTGVRSIVQTAAGQTWLQGTEGLYCVSTAALARAFNHPGSPLSYRLFDFRDGLTSPGQHSGFVGPQLAESSDGRVWLLTQAGVAVIDPAHLVRDPLPPPVAITALTKGDVRYHDPRSLVLAAGTRSVDIDYSALSLAMPARVKFRYRLDGVDPDWIDPGQRRTASYSNLGPGRYRFTVIAANGDGVWNRTGKALDFVIRPTFVQSWIFKALCAVALALLLWLGYSLRMRTIAARVRTAMGERLRERENIARELHDTLLQAVQALMLRFQLAAEELPAGAPSRNTLENALDRAEQVIAEGRDRLSGLRASDAVDNIETVLRTLVNEQGFGPDVTVSFGRHGEPIRLAPIAAEEAALIANEALFNIRRHAGASRVSIDLSFRPSAFELEIDDNGVGIDPELSRSRARAGHFGLQGMRERAARLGGKLVIEKPEGGGTRVVLTVPSRIAYATPGRPPESEIGGRD